MREQDNTFPIGLLLGLVMGALGGVASFLSPVFTAFVGFLFGLVLGRSSGYRSITRATGGGVIGFCITATAITVVAIFSSGKSPLLSIFLSIICLILIFATQALGIIICKVIDPDS